jgi:hypothetical protein
VRRRFLESPPAAAPGESIALVAFYYQLLPFDRLEDLDQ